MSAEFCLLLVRRVAAYYVPLCTRLAISSISKIVNKIHDVPFKPFLFNRLNYENGKCFIILPPIFSIYRNMKPFEFKRREAQRTICATFTWTWILFEISREGSKARASFRSRHFRIGAANFPDPRYRPSGSSSRLVVPDRSCISVVLLLFVYANLHFSSFARAEKKKPKESNCVFQPIGTVA